jgi:hypothetical protein
MTPPTRYLLIWFSLDGMTANRLIPIRRQIEDTVKEDRAEVAVDLWLESPGGDAHTAYKLALILRHVAGHIRVVVPDYAKSAATLLALVGDEIFLSPGAELGPLDAQMLEEGSLSGVISALNIARAADEVARDAVTLAAYGGAEMLSITGLGRAQTLEAMLAFAAKFSEPLVRQLDPRLVHDAKQTLRVTAKYAERLLERTLPSRNVQVAGRLVETFPTHGFVIDYWEAKRLGLPVKPMAEYEYVELARKTHRIAEDTSPNITFCKAADFFDSLSGIDEAIVADENDTVTERRAETNADGQTQEAVSTADAGEDEPTG